MDSKVAENQSESDRKKQKNPRTELEITSSETVAEILMPRHVLSYW